MEEPRHIRRTGRSTRLADEAIQTLFTEGEVKVRDHHESNAAHKDLLDRILFRFTQEHKGLKLAIDLGTFTIKIIK